MSAQLFYLPFNPVFTSRGLPAGAAQAFFYYTGTTTQAPVYSDDGLTQRLPQPVKANALGGLPNIYMDGSITYRVRIIEASGAQLGSDIDEYIPGTARQGVPGPPGAGGNVAITRAQLKTGPAAAASPGDIWTLSESRRDGDFKMTAGVSAFTSEAIDIPVSGAKYFARVDTREYIANWWPGVVGDGTQGPNPTGTDNTAGIQLALNETKARGGRKLTFLPGQYNVAGPLQTVAGGAGPAQIFLPGTDIPSGDVFEPCITIGGINPPGKYVPDPRGATIIQSTLPGTGGACIGSKNPSGHNNGAILDYYIQNLCLRGMPNPGITMLDAYFLPTLDVRSVTCDVANTNNGFIKPTYTNVPAIRGPKNNLPLWNNYDDLAIFGWHTGIQPGELFAFGNVSISHCVWLMHIQEALQHPGVISRLVGTSFENGILVEGFCEIDIRMWDIEHASRPGWQASNTPFTGYDVYDPAGALRHSTGKEPNYHLHDGTPLNILGKNFKWTPPYPWQFNQTSSYARIFPGFENIVDARSVRELVAKPGQPTWDSQIVNVASPTQGQVAAAYSITNYGNPNGQSVIGQLSFYYDGAPGSAGCQLYTSKSGTAQVVLDVDSNGYPSFPKCPAAASDSDASAKGIKVGGLYRNGNVIQIRIA